MKERRRPFGRGFRETGWRHLIGVVMIAPVLGLGSEWGLRLVAPILAVVALLSFVSTASEFVIASVVLTDLSSQTLAVGLYGLVSQETSKNGALFAAGALLSAVPVMVLFVLLQKYIVRGLTAGAVR